MRTATLCPPRKAGIPRRAALLAGAVLVALAACGGGGGGDGVDVPDPGDLPGRDVTACPAGQADVRVVVLDAWGRRLPSWDVRVSVTGRDPVQATATDPELRLQAEAELSVEASAPDHLPATVRWHVRPATPAASELREATGGARGDLSTLPGTCPRATLYLGLDHAWYAASGRPPRPGNRVDLLMDGEAFWAAVDADLRGATADVRATTWWWQSDFELTRPEGHETMTEAARRARTMLARLDASPAAKRVLVNRFTPDSASGLAYVNTDPDLRDRGRTPGDAFEVILQGNAAPVPVQGRYEGPAPAWSFPDRVRRNPEFGAESFPDAGSVSGAVLESIDAASWHQKAVVLDGRIAFVSGMNVKSTDWDTSDHRVFDSRRMKFLSSNDERARVRDKRLLPDVGPRKDYGVRVEGPAARDADDVMRVRWDLGLAQGAMLADGATPFTVPDEPAPGAGATTLQVVATMPAPIAEQSILETWRKALRNAERAIYIEDQYFRMPVVLDEMLAALAEHPALRVVVVTKPVSSADGGRKWTLDMDARLRAAAPGRYRLLRLKSFDAVARTDPAEGDETAPVYFVDMDVHSKILLVDDAYLSVGSCNKNNRGLLYEGELDVAVHDPAWVKAQRQRIVRNLLGPRLASRVGDDPDADFDLLAEAAEGNAAAEAWWLAHASSLSPAQVAAAMTDHAPDGFAYPLEFGEGYVLDVGPDAF